MYAYCVDIFLSCTLVVWGDEVLWEAGTNLPQLSPSSQPSEHQQNFSTDVSVLLLRFTSDPTSAFQQDEDCFFSRHMDYGLPWRLSKVRDRQGSGLILLQESHRSVCRVCAVHPLWTEETQELPTALSKYMEIRWRIGQKSYLESNYQINF